ncbi:hypothetical protein K7432_016073 [Basidiobolus ranarum]|uniref:Uncharacterized protein n=1 Tax=Basidiobolus ranarum TaxID=34480 RepID=A0ABR2WF93_9FUNG
MIPTATSIPLEILHYQQPPDDGIPFVVAHVDPATSNIIYDRTSITRALALALIILLGLISMGILTIILVYVVNRWKRRHTKPGPILKLTPAKSIQKRQSQIKKYHVSTSSSKRPPLIKDESSMETYLTPPEPVLALNRTT